MAFGADGGGLLDQGHLGFALPGPELVDDRMGVLDLEAGVTGLERGDELGAPGHRIRLGEIRVFEVLEVVDREALREQGIRGGEEVGGPA